MLILIQCNPRVNSNQAINLPHPGMIEVKSIGKTFQQGWNDSLASPDERPGMATTFTYNFWLDSTEVTRRHYYSVTGKGSAPDSQQATIPADSVSWFDVVLFCNARSKLEHLDTVYIYSGCSIRSNGSVYDLTGLHYDLSKDGYRLPTESEWEFAARGGSSALPYSTTADSSLALQESWYDGDASNTLHSVGTKMPNQLGFSDMAGNVFEWTNDWKGPYNGKPITNSLGAPQPDANFEKVIKGGSFDFDYQYLRPSRRSLIYPTVLSAACNYVGFRCARGPIPNGQFISAQPTDTALNAVTIGIAQDSMASMLGTGYSKVVFVNVTGSIRTLCVVDFSTSHPFVQQYTDVEAVNYPVVSPNGSYVAYCSAGMGISGPSRISIRCIDSLNSPISWIAADSAYLPHFWVNPSTGDTDIVFTNSSTSNNTSLWNSSGTFVQKVSNGLPVGAPQLLIADGSYHDGISLDGRFVVTSYPGLLMSPVQGNAKQLFCYPNNGKDQSASSQACNASMAPDTGSAPRCLFLDFGCSTTSSITGCSYGIHQYLFVSSYLDSVTNYLRCPANENSWDFPKWSNQSQFAVACGELASGQDNTVYVIDLNKRIATPILSGYELEEPYLWTGPIFSTQFNLAMDSIGLYDDPSIEVGQSAIAFGLHFFWRRQSAIDLLFLGSSWVQAGIDNKLFTGHQSLSIGYPNFGLLGLADLIQDYAIPHAPSIRLIGFSIPFGSLSNPLGETSTTWWSNSIGSSKGFVYDGNHNFWKSGVPAGFIAAVTAATYPDWAAAGGLDTLGEWPDSCGGWGGPTPDMSNADTNWTINQTNYQSNLNSLIAIIQALSAHQIHLLAISFPESPYYRNFNLYGRYGPSLQTGQKVIAQLDSLQQVYPYFHVYDAHLGGNHDYTDADAHDYDHLCPTGADKLSGRLGPIIDSILAQ